MAVVSGSAGGATLSADASGEAFRDAFASGPVPLSGLTRCRSPIGRWVASSSSYVTAAAGSVSRVRLRAMRVRGFVLRRQERTTRLRIAEQAALRIGCQVEIGAAALYDHDIVECIRSCRALREPEVEEQIVEAREVSRGRAGAEPVGKHRDRVGRESQVGACPCALGTEHSYDLRNEPAVILPTRQRVKRGDTRRRLIAVGGDYLKRFARRRAPCPSRASCFARVKAAWAVSIVVTCVPEPIA